MENGCLMLNDSTGTLRKPKPDSRAERQETKECNDSWLVISEWKENIENIPPVANLKPFRVMSANKRPKLDKCDDKRKLISYTTLSSENAKQSVSDDCTSISKRPRNSCSLNTSLKRVNLNQNPRNGSVLQSNIKLSKTSGKKTNSVTGKNAPTISFSNNKAKGNVVLESKEQKVTETGSNETNVKRVKQDHKSFYNLGLASNESNETSEKTKMSSRKQCLNSVVKESLLPLEKRKKNLFANSITKVTRRTPKKFNDRLPFAETACNINSCFTRPKSIFSSHENNYLKNFKIPKTTKQSKMSSENKNCQSEIKLAEEDSHSCVKVTPVPSNEFLKSYLEIGKTTKIINTVNKDTISNQDDNVDPQAACLVKEIIDVVSEEKTNNNGVVFEAVSMLKEIVDAVAADSPPLSTISGSAPILHNSLLTESDKICFEQIQGIISKVITKICVEENELSDHNIVSKEWTGSTVASDTNDLDNNLSFCDTHFVPSATSHQDIGTHKPVSEDCPDSDQYSFLNMETKLCSQYFAELTDTKGFEPVSKNSIDINSKCQILADTNLETPNSQTNNQKNQVISLTVSDNRKEITMLHEPEEDTKCVKTTQNTDVIQTTEELYPLEVQDLEDPGWDEYRHLTTDQGHYETVRKNWGSVHAPNPNRNLTVQNYRQRRLRESEAMFPQKVSNLQRKRKAESDLFFNEPPRKRKCKVPSTFLQEMELSENEKKYFFNLLLLRHDTVVELKKIYDNYEFHDFYSWQNSECDWKYHMPSDKSLWLDWLQSSRYITPCDELSHEIALLKEHFLEEYTSLTDIYNYNLSCINLRLEEVKAFDQFYVGLQENGENPTLISEDEKHQFILVNDLLNCMDGIYGSKNNSD